MKNTHWPITILSSISALLNMLLPMIMVRTLPSHEVGEFRIFFLYLMILPAVSLTVGTVNGIYYWANKRERHLEYLQNAWLVLVSQAILVFLVSCLAFFMIRREHFHFLEDIQTKYCILFLLGIIPSILTNFYDFTTIALGHIWRAAIFSSSFEICRTLFLVAVLLHTKSLYTMLICHTVIIYFRIILGAYLNYRRGIIKFQCKFELGTIRELLTYAAPVSLAAAFDVLLGSSDRLILSSFLPSSDYAFYVIGCLSIPPLLILEQSVNKVLIPKLSTAMDAGNFSQAVSLYKNSIKELSMILIPAFFGLVVFAKPILELLFTNHYSPASIYLRIYAFTYLILAIPFDALARASGNGKWILKNCVFFGIFSLTAVFFAARHFGALGALLGSILCQSLMRTYALSYTRTKLKAKWLEILPVRSLSIFVLVSFALSILSYMIRSFYISDRIWFFSTAPCFGVVYFLFIYGPKLMERFRNRTCEIETRAAL
jgi:O-antigen/teichoic acid export membrane protein